MPVEHGTPSAGRALLLAAARLVEAGVVSASGHGNLSLRLDDDRMLLAAGAPLPELVLGGLTVVHLDGGPMTGSLDPGALEIVPMHAEVYRHSPDVGAVVHLHSPAATAFAVAGRPLPSRYEGLLRSGQAVEVPVVPWAPRGSPKSVEGILAALEADPATWAVLLANHGVLVFGPSVEAAVDLTIALEEAAEAEWRAAALGGSQPFPPGALEAVRESMTGRLI